MPYAILLQALTGIVLDLLAGNPISEAQRGILRAAQKEAQAQLAADIEADLGAAPTPVSAPPPTHAATVEPMTHEPPVEPVKAVE